MCSAASLIIFTTLSGLGLGLAVLIGFGQVTASSSLWVVIHAVVSLGLIGAGVMSSTLHLGHPERAWRAMSQWRSSWLSREGVMAGLTTIVLAGYFLDQLLYRNGSTMAWYRCQRHEPDYHLHNSNDLASLKTIARWHHILTLGCVYPLALAGGCLLGAALQALAGTPPIQLSQWGIGADYSGQSGQNHLVA